MIQEAGMTLMESPEDLSRFPWSLEDRAAGFPEWLEPMVREGTRHFVANSDSQMHLLSVAGQVLPVTVGEPCRGSSYVVSPWSQYVGYAIEESARLPRRWQRILARSLLAAVHPCLSPVAMDRAVQVNNWLVSTNLWPAGIASYAGDLIARLARRWPDRPLLFRSLDSEAQASLVQALQEAGCRLLFSRIVNWQDPQSAAVKSNRQLRQDRRKWEKQGWSTAPVSLSRADSAETCRQLYRALYLGKYSALNPDYTLPFFQAAARSGFLQMEWLLDPGDRLAGVWGWWTRAAVMTQPVFGYDPSGPWGQSPYAALSLRVLQKAAQVGLKVNASAGAGHFKQQRGARPVVEYHAVFDRHLNFSARRPWGIVEHLAAKPIQEWLRNSGL